MNAIIVGIWYLLTYLLEKFLKSLAKNSAYKILKHIPPAAYVFFEIILVGIFTPHTEEVFIQRYVYQVSTEYGGLVDEVYVENGQMVKQGDLLFKLNSTRFDQSVETAKKELEILEFRYENSEKLIESGAISKNELKELALQIEANRFKLAKAQDRAMKTSIYSPSDGKVTNLQLRPGVFIPLRAPVMTLTDTTDKWAIAYMRQEGMSYVKVGDPVEMIFQSFPITTFVGEIEDITYGSGNTQFAANGMLPTNRAQFAENTFMLKIKLNEDYDRLEFGARGRGAVFTHKAFGVLKLIRRIENRTKSLMQYFWILL